MTTGEASATAADRNYREAYRKLVEHAPGAAWRDVGPVAAFTTRVPVSIFNGVLVLERAEPQAVGEAIDWVRDQGFPFRLWARVELLEAVSAVARDRGMKPDSRPYPGMLLDPVPPSPGPPDGVTVRPVDDEQALAMHHAVLVEGGLDADVARTLFPPDFAFDPDVRLFTAMLDRRPVGTSMAIRTGDVSGVYNVATHPEARRRGVGRAATWAAVSAGRAWGCRRAVLQASEMGEPLYTAMGFRPVVRYTTFRPVE